MSSLEYLRVRDVYDLAYDVAQEFESLSSLNVEEATPLIYKVIHVLELLEDCVQKLDDLARENEDLRAKYLQFSREKTIQDSEELNLKSVFEELEESWEQESQSLKTLISRLKSENESLKSCLIEKKDLCEAGEIHKMVIEDQEKLISKLSMTLKENCKTLEKNSSTIESLSLKVDQLLSLNKSIQSLYQEAKAKISSLSAEEQEQRTNSQVLNSSALGRHIASQSVLEKKNVSQPSGVNSDISESGTATSLLQEENRDLKEKVGRLESEISLIKRETREYRQKLLVLAILQNQNISFKPNKMQQIFQLFLGLFAIHPLLHCRGQTGAQFC